MINNELEGVWKEAVVTLLRYCLGMCVESLRKATKKLRIAGIGDEI
jgi:hypothetical protein